ADEDIRALRRRMRGIAERPERVTDQRIRREDHGASPLRELGDDLGADLCAQEQRLATRRKLLERRPSERPLAVDGRDERKRELLRGELEAPFERGIERGEILRKHVSSDLRGLRELQKDLLAERAASELVHVNDRAPKRRLPLDVVAAHRVRELAREHLE